MPICAFLSFRFSSTDGVSIVARRWMTSMTRRGFDVVSVAAEGADRTVRGIGLTADGPPDVAALADALADADLVVVENLCTIPLNVPAALAAAGVLRGRPTIMHHHDPPWHRPRYAHLVDLPIDDAAWAHVSITRTAAAELADRGISSTVIYNGFDPPTAGDRRHQREVLGVGADELLVAHPVRAIERKNLPRAIALAEGLGATYWLLGPAEEGFDAELLELLTGARCRVIRAPCSNEADIYAAADVVAFPSLWEGFGNPPIEAALHRRPAAVGDYPFAAELRRLGFEFFNPRDVNGLRAFIAAPDDDLLDRNQRLALEHFSMDRVDAGLETLLDARGWSP